MSAGNRKNQYRPSSVLVEPKSNRAFVYLMALLAAAGLIIGLIMTSAPARADVNSELGPVANVYNVKGVYGTKATGFYVRYYNGVVKVLPPMQKRLKDADDGAERYMIKHRYQKLADLRDTLDDFAANQVFRQKR